MYTIIYNIWAQFTSPKPSKARNPIHPSYLSLLSRPERQAPSPRPFPPPRPPGAAVRAPAPPGPAPVRLRLRPPALRLSGGRGSRAGPSPRRRPSRQQQREGGGTSRPVGRRPAAPTSTAPVLHPPCTLGPSIQARQQGKGTRNTLDPHPSTYQCTIQDFIF